jgi:hypothetical protein
MISRDGRQYYFRALLKYAIKAGLSAGLVELPLYPGIAVLELNEETFINYRKPGFDFVINKIN